MEISEIIVSLALPILVTTMFLVGFRLVRGPHILDRVLALDYMTVAVTAILGLYAIATGQSMYLDIAAVTALLSFLGTVGFAYYVEQQQERNNQ